MELPVMNNGIAADYHKKEVGYAWFQNETAKALVLSVKKSDLPKSGGLYPERVQVGAFRVRYWGLADNQGRFLTKSVVSELNRRNSSLSAA